MHEFLRLGPLAALLLVSAGCVWVEDFDQYSAKYGEAADSTTEVLAPTDTGEETEPSTDTSPADTTTTPVDTGPTCTSGQLNCGAGCIDVLSDRDHCGACTTCEQQGVKGAAACVAGKCACRPGATRCGDTCVYTDHDPRHCGACNAPIKDSTVVCNGACVPPLDTCKEWGFGTTCPVTCVDTASEGNHCYETVGTTTTRRRCWGSNEGACIANKCSTAACTGVGRKDCTAKFGPSVDPNVRSCVDSLHDPNNCGECGIRCAVGEVCAEGTCARYRAARSAADCTLTERLYTPWSWTRSVCIPK